MAEQLYYEDVMVGSEIPALVKHPTTQQLVRWAGASGDYNPIHYDKDFAQSKGLPGVIVHGRLIASFLVQFLTDWIGEEGMVQKLTCDYRGMIFPGEDLTCRGKVTKKEIVGGEHHVECEIWVENPKGERPVPGTATIILPSRD